MAGRFQDQHHRQPAGQDDREEGGDDRGGEDERLLLPRGGSSKHHQAVRGGDFYIPFHLKSHIHRMDSIYMSLVFEPILSK